MLNDIVLIYLAAVNLLAFGTFGLDKYRAVKGKWRVPERRLFLLAAAGGSAGALLGMYVFHHKTQKPKFTIGIPLILAAQLLIICASFTQAAAFHNCEKAMSSIFENVPKKLKH